MKRIFTFFVALILSFGSLIASDGSKYFATQNAQKISAAFSISNISQDDIDIKVSPNPANDYFNVTSNINFNRIQLYNIIGKPLKTYRPSVDNNYQLNDIPGGIYILRFMDGNNQVIKTVKLYKKN